MAPHGQWERVQEEVFEGGGEHGSGEWGDVMWLGQERVAQIESAMTAIARSRDRKEHHQKLSTVVLE